MRRPSPLPSSPPASAPATRSDGPGSTADGIDDPSRLLPGPARAAATSARREASPQDETVPLAPLDGSGPLAPLDGSGPLAPLVPLAPVPADQADHGAAPGESATGGAAAPDETARPLGWRDVWSAARARRRALRREIRRFTARQRRRRTAWLVGIGAVVLVALGAVAVAYSPLFAVSTITVVGTDRLDAAAVEDALSGQRGIPLALVDSSDVKAALVAFPLVETYTVEARPPQELVVRIVERTPIGSVSSKAGHTLVDAAGVALQTTKKAPKGYPRLDVTGGPGSRAFTAVGAVYRALPEDLRAGVTAMSATTPNDVTLRIGGADVLWGSSADSAQKAVVLAAAMVASPPKEVEMYDISSPGAVVIR